MSKLIFKELYLFSSQEKKAKKLEFSPGKTMITSSLTDGTDRGKSVIMKSLYHAMGADCFFEGMWDDSSKTYILLFSIDDVNYYIYRHNKLFKVFNAEKTQLFIVVSRHELAEKMFEILNFAVKLPQRQSANNNEFVDRLEIAPPAYNYLLNFIDQDKQNGSSFSSFQSLGEYPDFKENTLYYHFGAFDDNYYNYIQQLERVQAEGSKLTKELDMMYMMLARVATNINGVSYSKDIDHLKLSINQTRDEYNRISHTLSDLRRKLVSLRNDKFDIESHLRALSILENENERQLTSLKGHTCPLCKTSLDNTLDLRIKRYNTGDDIILLSSDMQYSIGDIERKIQKLEEEYALWLIRLNEYDEALNIRSSEVNDILRHKGFMDIQDQLSSELISVQTAINSNKAEEKIVRKELRRYNDVKKRINERYYTLMLCDKNLFGLEGINPKSLENINKTFSAGGSNNPISTIIWYVNLLQLRQEFNPDAILLPVVFDSPNNAETDDEKRGQIYKYISERVTMNQLIVSGIGFTDDIDNTMFDKVITLSNKKYELLCEEDYQENLALLHALNTPSS